jgi:hypothetical protein
VDVEDWNQGEVWVEISRCHCHVRMESECEEEEGQEAEVGSPVGRGHLSV